MTTRQLIALHVSPFSERAKWALDHHGLDYELVHHVPFIGERKLRRVVGPQAQRATVPVLVEDGEVIADSFAIARWADRHGAAAKLVPQELESEIVRWVGVVDAATDAGRALITAKMIASDGALDESLPRGTPGALRRLLRPVSRYGIRWFGRKYAVSLTDLAPHNARVRDGLLAIRAGLGAPGSEPRHLVGAAFTWADITAATALQAIVPVDDRFLRLGPATRRVWTNQPLADEFPDLIAWRDALYAKHRPAPARRTRAAVAA